MIIPIRCFSCGKVTGNKYERYVRYLHEGMTEEKALDKLGLVRYCCRRMLISHVERIEQHLLFTPDSAQNKNDKRQKTAPIGSS